MMFSISMFSTRTVWERDAKKMEQRDKPFSLSCADLQQRNRSTTPIRNDARVRGTA